MKRIKLLKILNQMGVIFIRHGKKHDVYKQPMTKIETTVPRHNDIKEFTAKSIIKTLSPISDSDTSMGKGL